MKTMDALVDRIIRLIQDDGLRSKMGEFSLRHTKRFPEKIIMRKWIDLFVQLREEGE